MTESELNTEQIILEAAEAEFLEKGYGNTKMMVIARRANVAHSMLHYYFRSKENLFQTIFLKKAQMLLPLFDNIFEQQLPFFETMRVLIKTQFYFLEQNPKLPLFLLTELATNKENRTLLLDMLSSKITKTWGKLEELLDEEIKKGTVRPISLQDLVMNIVSMNAASVVVIPILQEAMGRNDKSIEDLLVARYESNVEFILAALKP